MSGEYGLQLDRALDSLRIPDRFRTDFGDLGPLMQSMRERGLLQPPTITPEGIVLIGGRRVAAARELGWRTISVWVRSGLSDRVGRLLAEHDDHITHKPLNLIEEAALYRELKTVFAEAAALRQRASRFGRLDDENGGTSGAEESSPPGDLPMRNEGGRAREQAARLVTGRAAFQKLDQVCRIEDIANDQQASESLRSQARDEIELMRNGAAAYPSHLRMNAALTLDQLDRIAANPAEPEEVREQARKEAARVRDSDAKAAEMERIAKAALQRVQAGSKRKSKPAKPVLLLENAGAPVLYSTLAFRQIWSELDAWWEHYDLTKLARELSEEELGQFLRIVDGTVRFADELRAARADAA